jgi:hypothetical protein
LLRLFATYNVVWLPQEVRVDCKKIIVMWGCRKNKTKIHIVPVFAKKRKNTLIDVVCTQKKLLLVATCLSILGCNLVAKKT